MLKIHQLGDYGWNRVCAMAKSPLLHVVAHVSYMENQKAKDFKFMWNPENKTWWKELKQLRFEEERGDYQFEYTVKEEK